MRINAWHAHKHNKENNSHENYTGSCTHPADFLFSLAAAQENTGKAF